MQSSSSSSYLNHRSVSASDESDTPPSDPGAITPADSHSDADTALSSIDGSSPDDEKMSAAPPPPKDDAPSPPPAAAPPEAAASSPTQQQPPQQQQPKPLTNAAPAPPAPSSSSSRPTGNPLGNRTGRPARSAPGSGPRIPPSLQAKMAALANRGAASPRASPNPSGPIPSRSPPSAPAPSGNSLAARMAAMPTPSGGLGARRKPPGMSLAAAGFSAGAGAGGPGGGLSARRGPPGRLSDAHGAGGGDVMSTPFANFGSIVDPTGKLNFGNGKAILHAKGVDFSNGQSFAIHIDDLELKQELGRGNYGTVRCAEHRVTKVVMAIKEIRLELDQAKLAGIAMELDILHRAVAPQIIEFYGAFFTEGCIYYCMEYMDAGSLDKLYAPGEGVPEDVMARVTSEVVKGLKFLKDEMHIMHRDVKPTNVLVNRSGAIKLCDFGVSGQLEKSLAKTNIGCQSYMAPERIEGQNSSNAGTYSASSDVWSLGLSLVELAHGEYPLNFANVFDQLQAIVKGDAPDLPEGYSETAKDFVRQCMSKNPKDRPQYSQLLEHPWLACSAVAEVNMAGWVDKALFRRKGAPLPLGSAAADRPDSAPPAPEAGAAAAADDAPAPAADLVSLPLREAESAPAQI